MKNLTTISSIRCLSTKFSLAILMALTLVGCAIAPPTPRLIEITYDSSPRGAFFESQKSEYGQLPITFTYPPTESFKSGGCMDVDPIKVVTWKSGVQTIPGSTVICGNRGYSFSLQVNRPSGKPNLHVDMLAESELRYLESLESNRRQQAHSEMVRQLIDISNMNKPKATCTTNPMAGGGYSTNCY